MEIYSTTKNFPKEEMYGITSQLSRAAVSVPTNIVEGASRQHKKEYLHFLYISRGSLAETEYLLQLANKLDYLNDLKFKNLFKNCQDTAKTLFGLIKAIKEDLTPNRL